MKDLLPLGSVVLVKEATKMLLIIGTTQMDNEENYYDYIACPWPEGYLDEETFLLFNHEDIESVHFIGYVNAESQTYNQMIAQAEKEFIAQAEEDSAEFSDDEAAEATEEAEYVSDGALDLDL